MREDKTGIRLQSKRLATRLNEAVILYLDKESISLSEFRQQVQDIGSEVKGLAYPLTQAEPADAAKRQQLMRKARDLQRADAWGSMPEFPRDEWRRAVSAGETNLGYWQWVRRQIHNP